MRSWQCCVVLCGAVWCCVVLCGAVWCCVVLCGAVWCCVVLCGRCCLRFLSPNHVVLYDGFPVLCNAIQVLSRCCVVLWRDTYCPAPPRLEAMKRSYGMGRCCGVIVLLLWC
jgi:hypothetical protein